MARTFFLYLFLILTISLFANGNEEAASSSTRGKYLAESGQIIPPGEIRINSYISHIDYQYPNPADPVGVSFLTGQNILSTMGNEIYIQVGLQGRETKFEDLPPINMVFVLDASGSMAAEDKINWAKKGIIKTISRLRVTDSVSIITVGSELSVVQEPTTLRSDDVKSSIIERVKEIQPHGDLSIINGLIISEDLIDVKYQTKGINRVMLLTDGRDLGKTLDQSPVTYKHRDINITTVGFGIDFNMNPMIQLAKLTGGSSRFISDSEELDKVFNSELDRAIVTVARNLKINITLSNILTDIETWGYNHNIVGNRITYTQPSIHNGDSETILIRCKSSPLETEAIKEIATLDVGYYDLFNQYIEVESKTLDVEFKTGSIVTNISSPEVSQSSVMLNLGEVLKEIGTIHTDKNSLFKVYRPTTNMRSDLVTPDEEVERHISEEGRINSLSEMIYRQRLMDITHSAYLDLFYTNLKFPEPLFEDEVNILKNYFNTINAYNQQIDIETLYINHFSKRVAEDDFNRSERVFWDELLYHIPDGALVVRSGDFTPDLNLYTIKAEKVKKEFEHLAVNYSVENMKLLGDLLKVDYLITTNEFNLTDGSIITGRVIDTGSGKIVSSLNLYRESIVKGY